VREGFHGTVYLPVTEIEFFCHRER
jgi:hypothetical protein